MKLINPYTMHKTTAIIQADQDRRKKDEEKMLIAEFGNDMMNMISSANTPKELKKTFTEKTKYWAKRGLPNQIQAFWFGKVMDAQKSMLDQQAAQEQRDQRNTLFQQQQDDHAQAKNDERLLGQLQNPKAFAGGETYPQGVEGVYSVPADKQSLLAGLSYQGRNRYDADQNAEQDRKLKNDLIQAQINKTNRPTVKDNSNTKFTQAGKLIEQISGKYEGLSGESGESVLAKTAQDIITKYKNTGLNHATAEEKAVLMDAAQVEKLRNERKAIYGMDVGMSKPKAPSFNLDSLLAEVKEGRGEVQPSPSPAPGKQTLNKPKSNLSNYSNAQIANGYVYATSPQGQTVRLFKVEGPEVKYGLKTYPNPKYQEYLNKLKELGLN